MSSSTSTAATYQCFDVNGDHHVVHVAAAAGGSDDDLRICDLRAALKQRLGDRYSGPAYDIAIAMRVGGARRGRDELHFAAGVTPLDRRAHYDFRTAVPIMALPAAPLDFTTALASQVEVAPAAHARRCRCRRLLGVSTASFFAFLGVAAEHKWAGWERPSAEPVFTTPSVAATAAVDRTLEDSLAEQFAVAEAPAGAPPATPWAFPANADDSASDNGDSGDDCDDEQQRKAHGESCADDALVDEGEQSCFGFAIFAAERVFGQAVRASIDAAETAHSKFFFPCMRGFSPFPTALAFL